MFLQSHAFVPDFDPIKHLQPSEREVYAIRAKVAMQRYVWSDALLPVFKNCLVHLSPNVPGKVAYYASIPNLIANRSTRTSPEMFLRRSLVSAPGEIQAAWMSEVMGQTLPMLHFIKNNDPDGWYEVYNYGPHSCMEGSPRVRQYACPGSNLALAYSRDSDENINYRVIVNLQHKTYLRIYGAEDKKNYFVAALNKAGYTQSSDTLHGELIRLNYVPCVACGESTLVGPYLDGCWDLVEYTEHGIGRIGGHGETMNYSDDEIYCGCSNDTYHDD